MTAELAGADEEPLHQAPAKTCTAVRGGYPRLDDWLAVRERVDPAGVWASDLSRRLGLTPTKAH